MHRDFIAPDFDRPIDIQEYVSLVPPTATIKGMFITALLEALGPRRKCLQQGRARYVAFKDYPLVDQVRLVAEVAELLYPDAALREAIRRIGHAVYPAFAASLLGKVLFAAVGRDPSALIRAGAKAYEMSASVGKVEIVQLSPRSALLHLREMYNYIDCYQVGVFEGAFSVLGLVPALRMRLDSLTSGVFELRW
jgi:uncharacterized protein (TIGR02265 family)